MENGGRDVVDFQSFPNGWILSWRGIISTSVKDAIHTTILHTVGLVCSFLCFDFVYYPRSPPGRNQRRSSFPPLDTSLGSSFFLSLTLISHSIRRSCSVVTPLRLYKFYIIFMRHKVVEKPTNEEERGSRERIEHSVEGVGVRRWC